MPSFTKAGVVCKRCGGEFSYRTASAFWPLYVGDPRFRWGFIHYDCLTDSEKVYLWLRDDPI